LTKQVSGTPQARWRDSTQSGRSGISASIASITPTNSGYIEENEGGPDAFAKAVDGDGEVEYFDFTERMFVVPEANGCILSWNYQLGDCTGELADRRAVGEVERRDRRASAGGVDAVLDFLQRLGGAGDEDDVRALSGERFGGGGPDAAACAGDKRKLAGERFRIRHGGACSG
jgi:hypothetical protein